MYQYGNLYWIHSKKKGVLRFSVKNVAPSKIMYAEVLKIGIPVLLFQLLASAAMGTVNTASKPYGDYAVAAMGAVTRIMTVVTYVVFGFLKGFQPFAGYNYGAKKFDRLKNSIKLCMTWSTVFCVIAGIILIVFANPIVSLFGTDAEMIALAETALRLNAVLFITFGFNGICVTISCYWQKFSGKCAEFKQTRYFLFSSGYHVATFVWLDWRDMGTANGRLFNNNPYYNFCSQN